MEKPISVTFCTIITQSHLAWALALNHSLLQFDKDMSLYILVTDCEKIENPHVATSYNIKILYLKDLQHIELGDNIIKKYHNQKDELRWSLKPILMVHLLENYTNVFYCDADIYFFNSYQFLIKEVENVALLLTPHWRTLNPDENIEHYLVLFKHGIFNAGFVGASVKGREALITWAKLCLYKCEKDREKGYYDDQRYLDILMTYFYPIKTLRHLGCNVAEWNFEVCKRTLTKEGTILINDTFPIIFIHITPKLIYNILTKKDASLYPYLEKAQYTLLSFNANCDIIQPISEKILQESVKKPIILRIKIKLHNIIAQLTSKKCIQ